MALPPPSWPALVMDTQTIQACSRQRPRTHTYIPGHNIFFQIMFTFLSYISNACHSLSGVAERLQHTRTLNYKQLSCNNALPLLATDD